MKKTSSKFLIIDLNIIFKFKVKLTFIFRVSVEDLLKNYFMVKFAFGSRCVVRN
jgi:hypothetical protein